MFKGCQTFFLQTLHNNLLCWKIQKPPACKAEGCMGFYRRVIFYPGGTTVAPLKNVFGYQIVALHIFSPAPGLKP